MIRYVLSVRSIASVLLSAMFLMGMSCGAGGFSIPLQDGDPMVAAEGHESVGDAANADQPS